jgi:hypothetical protein
MRKKTTWNESDFDRMSWHDNHVHGVRIRAGEHGTGQLELDLDYILEWLRPSQGAFAFRIAPATLTFREVYDLRIEIDYEAPSAGLVPFSIAEIEREEAVAGHSDGWRIQINWPNGRISFRASGFNQELRAEPITTASQSLTHDERTLPGT